MPRYPVYVPTRGRAATPLTLRLLLEDGVPFWAVVEAEEAEAYAEVVGPERLLILPESGQGLIYARNWIKAHSIAAGHERHWQLDDNIRHIKRLWRGRRIPCDSGPALAAVEEFVDRYSNVGLAGLNYEMFVLKGVKPFARNVHVYSCSLVWNRMPYQWRLPLNDDTDLCLQVLAGGLCTVLVNAFLVWKSTTMTVKGGNTGIYQEDGRLRMARSLEQAWPGVVTVTRKYGRPQHHVNWGKFDTPLKLREGIDLTALPATDEHGMTLEAVRDIRSPRVKQLQADYEARA
jgi:hypothetical protein